MDPCREVIHPLAYISVKRNFHSSFHFICFFLSFFPGLTFTQVLVFQVVLILSWGESRFAEDMWLTAMALKYVLGQGQVRPAYSSSKLQVTDGGTKASKFIFSYPFCFFFSNIEISINLRVCASIQICYQIHNCSVDHKSRHAS